MRGGGTLSRVETSVQEGGRPVRRRLEGKQGKKGDISGNEGSEL